MSEAFFQNALEDNPNQLEYWDASFNLMASTLAKEMGFDYNSARYPVPENNQKIGFGTLPSGTLAQAREVYNDCEVYVVINRELWFKTYQQRRIWIYWHELGHDAFNLEHGEGGELMNAYAPNEKITNERLYNALKEMVRYALWFGKYERGGGYCKNGEIYYPVYNSNRSAIKEWRTKSGKIRKKL